MLDPTFGAGGIASVDLDTNFATIRAMAVQNDGRIIIAGRWFTPLGYDVFMLRFMPDGSLDPSFGDSGQATADLDSYFDECTSIAILPDSKIMVAGMVTHGSFPIIAMARFNVDGSLDSTYASGGVTYGVQYPNSSVRKMLIQDDGAILLAGDQEWKMAVFRYLPDGTPDSTFHADGLMTFQSFSGFNVLTSMALQDDGEIVVTGFGGSGQYNVVLARVLPNGNLDQAFGASGYATLDLSLGDDMASSVAIQNDGKIVIVGSTDYYPNYNMFIARFHADGWLDNTFGVDGLSTISISALDDNATDLVLQPDGKFLITGNTQTGVGVYSVALIRLFPNGQLDPSFGQNGSVVHDYTEPHNDHSRAVILQTDGKVLIAGNISGHPTVARFLSGLFISVEEEEVAHSTELSVYPNPTYGSVFLECSLSRPELVTVQIQDMQGRVIRTILNQAPLADGGQSIRIEMDGIAVGQYNVSVRTSQYLQFVRVVKL
ncbi:MAG: T9SS type A sorting domain-containing protein [Flavobacteriales bacterium]|nr:T9SS type A sorting domain-containing protein [Flavobacteriales bacterium]